MKKLNKKHIAVSITLLTILGLAVPSTFLFFSKSKSSPLDKTIVKQFAYEYSKNPIVDLNVSLYDGLGFHEWQLTNATGHVAFVGLNDETYTLKWMWGGVECSESKEIDCTKIVWDLGTNYLQSKSGGGLHLAEVREHKPLTPAIKG